MNKTPLVHRLVTDWGTITMPKDMIDMTPMRKDGWPDQRYASAPEWQRRLSEETEKLRKQFEALK